MTDNTFVFDGFEPANTTPVPDILFDMLLTTMSGAELKALLYIIRRTWGFKKTTDAISLTQFENGIITQEGRRLDYGVGLNRETICKALQSLEEKGYIKSHKRTAHKRDKDVTVYSIRFKGEASVVGKSDQVGSRKSVLPTVVGKSDYGSRKSPKKVVGKSDPQETVLQDTVKQETEESNGDESHTPTISPPDVGDSRTISSQSENHSQQPEHSHEGIEHPFTCYFEGQYYAACPLQEARVPVVSKKPAPHDILAVRLADGTEALAQVERYEDKDTIRVIWLEPQGQYVQAWSDVFGHRHLPLESSLPTQPDVNYANHGIVAFGEYRILSADEVAGLSIIPLYRRVDHKANGDQEPAQQNHSAEPPNGAVVGDDPLSNPPAQGAASPKGKGKKPAEPAPKCDTREIQRRINEHRGYGLEERVELIRERQAVKTWCNLHELEEFDQVMQGLKHDPYWGKPENYYRIGGLTLLKETSRVLAAVATQYKPALRIVSTSEQPTVSGRPRLDVPPEYLAMMIGARS